MLNKITLSEKQSI